MSVTNTIKPGGGGDYSTVQSWDDAVDGMSSDTYIGELDDSGNGGAVSFTTITSGSTLILRPETGSEHGGDKSAGAYIQVSSGNGIAVNVSNIQVKGIRVKNTGNSPAINCQYASFSTVSGVVIDGNLVECSPASGDLASAIQLVCSDCTSNTTIRNNICLATSGSAITSAINLSATGFNGNCAMTVSAQNNTIVGDEHWVAGIGLTRITFSFTVNLTANITNNVSIGSTTADFRTQTSLGTGTLSITSNNNASEDSTANWAGGSGHLTAIDPDVEFVDNATDWRLLEGATLFEAGSNLSASFTNDAYGNTRSLPWNIGAYGGEEIEPETEESSTRFKVITGNRISSRVFTRGNR